MASVRVGAALLLLLVGCEAEPAGLDWRIRFATPALRERAAAVEARVLRGRCGDPSATLVYTSVFSPGGMGARPRLLGPGEYSIEAYARDASCQRFAGDCADQRLPAPAGTVVELVLQARPDEPICPPGDICSAGECASERVDAGPPDAGRLPDASERPDRVVNLDGAWCDMSATDSTGRMCRADSDCDGNVCDDVFFGITYICTRTCTGDADCVAGWDCQMGRCTCEAFEPFGGRETACDGLDDDCDGRIDESDGERSACSGQGEVCVCTECVCPADLTPCEGGCFDLPTSPRHCGACDRDCGPGFRCTGGDCFCDGTVCSGSCVDLSRDAAHCGGCDMACSAGQVCEGADCVCPVDTCPSGCVDQSTDEANCGACGNSCSAGSMCCGGICRDVRSDEANCGSCGTDCTASTSTCCAGDCVNTNTDEMNCGACAAECAAGSFCSSGSCVDP
jgi:hypothetical protein